MRCVLWFTSLQRAAPLKREHAFVNIARRVPRREVYQGLETAQKLAARAKPSPKS